MSQANAASFVSGGVKSESFVQVAKDIVKSRGLIATLSKNDFRQRFAGSYLGIVWAFVQPVMTVFIYWFVFTNALNPGTQSTKEGLEIPYLLYLIGGLVPWFFFSEAIMAGTNVLFEYSYLVKKVVFRIDILPVVKVCSSLFVHLFFVGFSLVVYMLYGFYPTLQTLQLLYYFICMGFLVLGFCYLFSAIVVFFRDLTQIINILLQVVMWMTPIMWNMDSMIRNGSISPTVLFVLKLNPLYYIVSGYRDALLSEGWFFERPRMTLYFWAFSLCFFALGSSLFERLKVHFADVI